MTVYLVAFAVMLLVVVAMSVGAIVSNRPIKGSCGGLANLDNVDCAICGQKSGQRCASDDAPKPATRNAL